MNNRKKYFLGRDNDCHWYIIDAGREADWEEWLNLDGDDERCWNVPDFAKGIDSPSEIKFYLED